MTFRQLPAKRSGWFFALAIFAMGLGTVARAQDVFEDTTAATTPQLQAPASQQQLYCRQLERQLPTAPPAAPPATPPAKPAPPTGVPDTQDEDPAGPAEETADRVATTAVARHS